MTPKWQKLASLARKYVHSSFSSLVNYLLPNGRTYWNLDIKSKYRLKNLEKGLRSL